MLRKLFAVALAALVPLTFVTVSAAEAAAQTHTVDITFPAEEGSSYTDDYSAGRSGGRVHGATDIFNEMGSHVYAAVGGTIGWMPADAHATAGFAIQIKGDDGRLYAYYHLGPWDGTASQAFADGLATGSRVERGQHIGYLGNSGNARTTAPHLHFEIHEGDERVNPYFSLQAAEQRGDYPGGGASPSRSFPDITDSTHRAAIEALAEAGIVHGRSDGRFHTEDPVTRAEMSSFLQRALELPESEASFDDVNGSRHAGAVGALAEAEIVFGGTDGLFHPRDVVTRGQIAAFVSRAYGLEASGASPFRDTGASTHESAITALAEAGISQGYSNGKYHPGRPVTRGQVASLLMAARGQAR